MARTAETGFLLVSSKSSQNKPKRAILNESCGLQMNHLL